MASKSAEEASNSAEEASQFELKPEFHHTAGQKLPDAWVKRWRKWVRQNPPEGFSVKNTRFSGDLAAPVAKRPRLVGVYKGYLSAAAHPQLKEDPFCPHCLMGPCVIEMPPDFLVGNADADPGNLRKHFALYRKFWSLLQALGLWHDATYLQRKRAVTHQDDQRELLPLCVLTEIRRRFPNPPDIPYVELKHPSTSYNRFRTLHLRHHFIHHHFIHHSFSNPLT